MEIVPNNLFTELSYKIKSVKEEKLENNKIDKASTCQQKDKIKFQYG